MLPKPNLEQAVKSLSEREEMKIITEFLIEERSRFFADLRQAENTNDVMKIAGSIATLDEIISLLDMKGIFV
jgi:hypothetical protein